MPGDSEQPTQAEKKEGQAREGRRKRATDFVAPGVPIVRSSTPRPPSLAPGGAELHAHLEERGSAFPEEAPGAPPVPEECSPLEETPLPIASRPEKGSAPGSAQPAQERNEFLWLFEYGPEMDSVLLNSPQMLDGLALPYGPGMLKGYELGFGAVRTVSGEVVVSILPSSDPGAAVWGMLYRVPRRLALPSEESAAPLDKIHDAVPPMGLFEPHTVVVHEPLRQREIPCTTYIASATVRRYFQTRLPERYLDDPYVQHLLESARRQKLPESYLLELENRLSTPAPTTSAPAQTAAGQPEREQEQDTEPIPVVREQATDEGGRAAAQREAPEQPLYRPAAPGWFTALALYHALLLLAVLSLAVLEGLGLGREIFNAAFTPLGVPWFVLAYGLLGGCVSCLVTLGRRLASREPVFLLITWFVRPCLGIVLAMLAYLLLDSGLIALGAAPGHAGALFSLVGMLAGYCEHRLMLRHPRSSTYY
jgi:hypothetical protein